MTKCESERPSNLLTTTQLGSDKARTQSHVCPDKLQRLVPCTCPPEQFSPHLLLPPSGAPSHPTLTQSKANPTPEECLELGCFTVIIKPHMRKKNDTVPLQKFLAEKHLMASSFSAPFHWMRKQAPFSLGWSGW